MAAHVADGSPHDSAAFACRRGHKARDGCESNWKGERVHPPSIIRVLCVEDNALVANSVCGMLSREDTIEVVGHLASADEMLETATSLTADVVVLDLDMPGLPALEALDALRRRDPDIRVLIHSGYCDKANLKRAIDCGAWGFVCKDDPSPTLVEAIRRVVGGEVVLSPSARRCLT
jgi:two-component system, NarL family, response regulator DesR